MSEIICASVCIDVPLYPLRSGLLDLWWMFGAFAVLLKALEFILMPFPVSNRAKTGSDGGGLSRSVI